MDFNLKNITILYYNILTEQEKAIPLQTRTSLILKTPDSFVSQTTSCSNYALQCVHPLSFRMWKINLDSFPSG